jgi:Spy/CpxP family protein refolding chaperone
MNLISYKNHIYWHVSCSIANKQFIRKETRNMKKLKKLMTVMAVIAVAAVVATAPAEARRGGGGGYPGGGYYDITTAPGLNLTAEQASQILKPAGGATERHPASPEQTVQQT